MSKTSTNNGFTEDERALDAELSSFISKFNGAAIDLSFFMAINPWIRLIDPTYLLGADLATGEGRDLTYLVTRIRAANESGAINSAATGISPDLLKALPEIAAKHPHPLRKKIQVITLDETTEKIVNFTNRQSLSTSKLIGRRIDQQNGSEFSWQHGDKYACADIWIDVPDQLNSDGDPIKNTISKEALEITDQGIRNIGGRRLKIGTIENSAPAIEETNNRLFRKAKGRFIGQIRAHQLAKIKDQYLSRDTPIVLAEGEYIEIVDDLLCLSATGDPENPYKLLVKTEAEALLQEAVAAKRQAKRQASNIIEPSGPTKVREAPKAGPSIS